MASSKCSMHLMPLCVIHHSRRRYRANLGAEVHRSITLFANDHLSHPRIYLAPGSYGSLKLVTEPASVAGCLSGAGRLQGPQRGFLSTARKKPGLAWRSGRRQRQRPLGFGKQPCRYALFSHKSSVTLRKAAF